MAIDFLKFFTLARPIETAFNHHREGRPDEAETGYRQVLEDDPNNFDALKHLGELSAQLGRHDQAIELFSRAITINPSFAPVHNNLGTMLKRLGRRDEAIVCFKQAIALDPCIGEAYYNLGQVEDRHDEVLRCFREATIHLPEAVQPRWAWTMWQIPAICDVDRDPRSARESFSAELDALANWFDVDPNRMAAGFAEVGNRPPFYLAYHEESNKEVLSRYGELCARVMSTWHQKQQLPPVAARAGGKIQIGIVSAHVREHSVWTAIVKGWLQHIDSSRFDVRIFHVGGIQDRHTDFARSRAASFEEGPKDLPQWVNAIRGRELDVLIYPEICMDPMTVKLSAMRLAPVQATTWGHPETSGLPTMDYYLSAEDFEPADEGKPGWKSAQEHYAEQLIVLPHLGCCYPPLLPDRIDPDLAAMGINPELPLLLCAGSGHKYQPRHDRVLVDIARRLGECQIIFIISGKESAWSLLRRRLEAAFARAELDFGKQVVFIPWQDRPAFYGLMQRVDVLLDTIGFSGFNTAMQAIECGLPIVAREGRFMRGRLASGILKRMGLSDLVAHSDEEYVSMAVKLARDDEYRAHVRSRIDVGRHILFNDTVPIRALEDFLTGAAHRARREPIIPGGRTETQCDVPVRAAQECARAAEVRHVLA